MSSCRFQGQGSCIGQKGWQLPKEALGSAAADRKELSRPLRRWALCSLSCHGSDPTLIWTSGSQECTPSHQRSPFPSSKGRRTEGLLRVLLFLAWLHSWLLFLFCRDCFFPGWLYSILRAAPHRAFSPKLAQDPQKCQHWAHLKPEGNLCPDSTVPESDSKSLPRVPTLPNYWGAPRKHPKGVEFSP